MTETDTPMLAAVCDLLGEPPQPGYRLHELADLARRAEFAADAALLGELATRGRVPRPGPDGFTAAEADEVLRYLDAGRLWVPRSRLHDWRKCPSRIDRERLGADGSPLPNADKLSLNQLALLLAVTPASTGREWLAEVLLARLAELGVSPHA